MLPLDQARFGANRQNRPKSALLASALLAPSGARRKYDAHRAVVIPDEATAEDPGMHGDRAPGRGALAA